MKLTRHSLICAVWLTLFCASGAVATAQTWTFRNGFGQAGIGYPDRGSAICSDASGNIYVTGKISDGGMGNTVSLGGAALVSAGDDDGFVAKFSSTGVHLWSLRFGGATFVDEGFGIATDGTSVYVTGEVAGAMTVGTSATSYPLVGGASGSDGFVMKLDAGSSAVNWVTRFGGNNTDRGQAICLDPSGNVYISGFFRTNTANPNAIFGGIIKTVQGNFSSYSSDLFIAKLNSSGAFQWVSTGGSMGGNDNILGSGICYIPTSGQVAVTGSFRTLTSQGASTSAVYLPGGITLTNSNLTTNEDLCLLKADAASGTFVGGLSIGAGDGNEAGLGITYDASTQQAYFCGYFSSANVVISGIGTLTNGSGTTRHNILYGRYNVASNTFGWVQEVNNSSAGAAADDAFGITSNGAGGIFITGQFRNTATFPGALTVSASGPMSDIYLAKVAASDGTAQWVRSGSGSNTSGDDIGYAVTVQGSDVWITGQYLSTLTFTGLSPLNSAGNTEDIVIAKLVDPATVLSVSVPANGTYKVGDILSFTVNYSSAVTVNTAGGTPTITLTIGPTARTLSYTSGSGTTALVFRYTVQAGDLDVDGVALGSSIALNSGTIRNNSTTVDASLVLTNVPSTANVLVDGVVPVVNSINRQSPASPTNATSMTYRITFSESVSGVDVSDFSLTSSGSATGNISSVSAASGTTIDVVVNSVAGNGTLRLDLKASGTGIVDAAGNGISGGFTSGQTFSIDNATQAPVLTTPATGNAYFNPIPIVATLPETPQAGSVQLVFSNSSNTVTLTLTNATSFNFSLNINTPTSSPQVSSASGPIPPGTYTVTFRYRDALGNAQSSVANASVMISFALPVTLTSFEASLKSNAVRLNWVTASEENTDKFEVLHSADGINFTEIGTVRASGSSSVSVKYAFDHSSPSVGANYYRLRTRDIDGSFSLSAIVRINWLDAGQITLYPVPAGSEISIRFSVQNVRSVNVLDLQGRTVRQQLSPAGNEVRFGTAGLPSGEYFVQILHDGGVLQTKFLKH